MKRFAVGLAASCVLQSAAAWQAQILPTQFDHDRVFIVLEKSGEPPLRFYTDSGGGLDRISASAAKRLALKEIASIDIDGSNQPRPIVEFPASLGVPAPDDEPVSHGGLVVQDLGTRPSGPFDDAIGRLPLV
jgi:hypothetical protein